MNIKLTYHKAESVLRQSPGERGVWEGSHFFVEEAPREYEGWVVYEDLPYPQSAECEAGHCVFVTGEPSSVRSYDAAFLDQFAAVVTPQPGLKHRNIIYSQPAIPWWVGVQIRHQPGKDTTGYTLNYDTLKAMASITKSKQISVICSSKAVTEGHRARLQLVEKLKTRFAGLIDFYGYGSSPVVDKWDAIAPYRYHIVVENTRAPHYWTEKLADCYLAGAMPVYCGCPNIAEYFPPESYLEINRLEPEVAIERISRLLEEDPYDRILGRIWQARDLVLDKYNLFPMLAGLLESLPAGRKRRVRIRPHRDFVDPFSSRIKRAAKRLVFGVGPRSG